MECKDNSYKAYCPWLDDSPTSLRTIDAYKQPEQRTIPKRLKKLIDEDLAAVSGNRGSTRDRLKEKLRRKHASESRNIPETMTQAVSAPAQAAIDDAHKSSRRKKRRGKVKKESTVAEKDAGLEAVAPKEADSTEKEVEVNDLNRVQEADPEIVTDDIAARKSSLAETVEKNEAKIEYAIKEGVFIENASDHNQKKADKENLEPDYDAFENPLAKLSEEKEIDTTVPGDAKLSEKETEYGNKVYGQYAKHADDIVSTEIVDDTEGNIDKYSKKNLIVGHLEKGLFSKQYRNTSANLHQILRRNQAIEHSMSDRLKLVIKMKAEIEKLKIPRFPLPYKIKEKNQQSWIQTNTLAAIVSQKLELNRNVQYGPEIKKSRQHFDTEVKTKCGMVHLSSGNAPYHLSIVAHRILVSKILNMADQSVTENLKKAFLFRLDFMVMQNEDVKTVSQKMQRMPLTPEQENMYLQMKRVDQFAFFQRNLAFRQRNQQMSTFAKLDNEVSACSPFGTNTVIVPYTNNAQTIKKNKTNALSIVISGIEVHLQFTEIIIDGQHSSEKAVLVAEAFSRTEKRSLMSGNELTKMQDELKTIFVAYVEKNKLIVFESDPQSSTFNQLFEMKICDIASILMNEMNTGTFETTFAAKLMHMFVPAIFCLAATGCRLTRLNQLGSSSFVDTHDSSFCDLGNKWNFAGQLTKLFDSMSIIKVRSEHSAEFQRFKGMLLPYTARMIENDIETMYESCVQNIYETGLGKAKFSVCQSGLLQPASEEEKLGTILSKYLQLNPEVLSQTGKRPRTKWKTFSPHLKAIVIKKPGARSKENTGNGIKRLVGVKLTERRKEKQLPLHVINSSMKIDSARGSSMMTKTVTKTRVKSEEDLKGRQKHAHVKSAKDAGSSVQNTYLQRIDRKTETFIERTKRDFGKGKIHENEELCSKFVKEEAWSKIKEKELPFQKQIKCSQGVICLDKESLEMKSNVGLKEQTVKECVDQTVVTQNTRLYIAQLHEQMKKANSFGPAVKHEIKTNKLNLSMIHNPHTRGNYFRSKQKDKYQIAHSPKEGGITKTETLRETNNQSVGTGSNLAENNIDAQNNNVAAVDTTERSLEAAVDTTERSLVLDSEQTHYGLRLCMFDEVTEARDEQLTLGGLEKLEESEQLHFGIRLCIFD